MKGLLHSKRFKKNLEQWLFMYIGVICLLTTVITYSKFMTSIQVNDNARPGNFSFEIKSVACPADPTVCNVSEGKTTDNSCRPTQVIASCFEIDTSGLEVASTLALSFYPALKTDNNPENDIFYIDDIQKGKGSAARYNIIGIDMIDENNKVVKIYSSDGKDVEENWDPINESHVLKLTKEIYLDDELPKNTGKWIFRVRTKKDNGETKNYQQSIPSSKIVKVGYSMIQNTATTKGGGNG